MIGVGRASGQGTVRHGLKFACQALLFAACLTVQQRPAGSSPGVPPPTDERKVENTTYSSADGVELPAVLSVPREAGRYPVVVTLHGGAGGRNYPFLRQHAAPDAASPTVRMLNGEPWAIYALGYRRGAILGQEEEDAIAGIRAISSDLRIDPSRVAVFGGSHGGQLALRAAMRLGSDISCVAAGSPWMTDPLTFFYGDPAKPPLSEISKRARDWLLARRTALLPALSRTTGVAEPQLREHLRSRSVEEHAASIRVPTLLITSHADEQVPHRLIEPLVTRMREAGREVKVTTVHHSLHGFYWGREGEFGARADAGPKTREQYAEEASVRLELRLFLQRCLRSGRAGMRRDRH